LGQILIKKFDFYNSNFFQNRALKSAILGGRNKVATGRVKWPEAVFFDQIWSNLGPFMGQKRSFF